MTAAWLRVTATTLLPVLLALGIAGGVLLALGVDPLAYYGYVARRALFTWPGLQETVTRTAPLLLIAASLIAAFRAGVWNLGVDGQYVLGALSAAALAPLLSGTLPPALALALGALLGMAMAALWSLPPALLRAYQGVNEIVTTLMMSFLAVSLSNALVKLAFLDPATTVPQTRTLPVADRLPRLLGTNISSGVVLAVLLVIAVHLVLTRTGLGLKLRVVGANPRAAAHAGLPVPALTVLALGASAALAGLAGAVDVLGVHGNVRADWNPAYGLTVIPLVFLARLNGFAAIFFVFLAAALQIGGESAARRLGVPHVFTLLVTALLLVMFALVGRLEQRRRDSPRAAA